MTGPENAPAGWYSDPAHQHERRYWDGSAWTAQVSDGGITTTDLMQPAPVPGQAQPQPAADTTPAAEQDPIIPWAPVTAATSAPAAAPWDQPAATSAPAVAPWDTPAAQRTSPTSPAAAPWDLPAAQNTSPAAQDSATAQTRAFPWAPVTADDQAANAAPPGKRRRRWPLITVAVVVLLGLATGLLVIWAPWIPPPVLRPTGLAAGPSTANSVTFHWSRPPTGPLPDKYLILNDNPVSVAGSVPGSATSWRQAGLDPATTYQYRVVAVRGGKRSPISKLLTVSTLTPPVSEARLSGSWTVNSKIVGPAPDLQGPRKATDSWQFHPVCTVGACDVKVTAGYGNTFKVKLTRVGPVYKGQTVANIIPCGSGSSGFADPSTLKIRIHVTAAQPNGQVWAASSWTGTMVAAQAYVASGNFFCNPETYTIALSGTPS